MLFREATRTVNPVQTTSYFGVKKGEGEGVLLTTPGS